MKRILILVSIVFALTAPAPAQNIHSKVDILLNSKAEIAELAGAGVILDHAHLEKADGSFVLKTILGQDEMALLKASGFSYRITVEDLFADYQRRKKQWPDIAQLENSDDPVNFELGDLGGFYTKEQFEAELDSMRSLYPHLITEKSSIGKTIEDRSIWTVKISDNPEVYEEQEPEVLYTSLHHAREPGSMQTLVYFMWYLLENYGLDPQVTYLLENRQLHFVPMINPDGYLYNQNGYEEGNIYWRKNRRDNGGGSYGVDLNRNYGHTWGYDDNGSSSNPSSAVYRGTGPFSEPETQAIRDFCFLHEFRLALNYHTYSNLLIYPWGYIASFETEDSTAFRYLGMEMTRDNRYVYGTGDQTVGYLVNGDSDDWMYGEQEEKNKIFSMTPEVGRYTDGFWPDIDRIYPHARENLYPNLVLAQAAGGLLRFRGYTLSQNDSPVTWVAPGDSVNIQFRIRNIGLGTAADARINIFNENEDILPLTESIMLDSLAAQTDTILTIPVIASMAAGRGLVSDLFLEIDHNGYTHYQPVGTFLVGIPNLLMTDNADSTISLFEGPWAKESSDSYSGENHYSDSPGSDYGSNLSSSFVLKKALPADSLQNIYLSFRTRWSIETGYDFGIVQASTDGSNWNALSGLFSYPGSGYGRQDLNEPGYHGTQLIWVHELIDLSTYAGSDSLYLRFNLSSDSNVEFDGWHIDDIAIIGYRDTPDHIGEEKPLQPQAMQLYQNYPNPFNPQTTLRFYLPKAQDVRLTVYDIHGRKTRTLVNGSASAGETKLVWDGNSANGTPAASGIYILKLQAGGHSFEKRMVLLR